MKKKNLFLIVPIIMILLINIVSAIGSVTIRTPATSGVISGNTKFNVSFTNTENEVVYCAFQCMSATTDNSSYVNMVNITNSTQNVDFVNGTINTASLQDSNDYSCRAICQNTTVQATSSAITSVRMDNTVPTAPSSLSPVTKTSDEDGSVTFTATVVDRETNGCTLYFSGTNPGSSGYSMTYSGSTCTKTLTNLPTNDYTWYIRATDNTNTTDSAHTQLNVDSKHTSAGKAMAIANNQPISTMPVDDQTNSNHKIRNVAIGAVAGAVVGSVVPGFGTVIGGIIGGIIASFV